MRRKDDFTSFDVVIIIDFDCKLIYFGCVLCNGEKSLCSLFKTNVDYFFLFCFFCCCGLCSIGIGGIELI